MKDSSRERASRTAWFAAAIACLILVAGCVMKWDTLSGSPEAVLGPDGPNLVRVTQTDSSQIVLADPVVRADSLVGVTQANSSAVSLPLSQVSLLEERVPNRVVNGIIGGAAALAGFLIGSALRGS